MINVTEQHTKRKMLNKIKQLFSILPKRNIFCALNLLCPIKDYEQYITN